MDERSNSRAERRAAGEVEVRRAGVGDAAEIGRLLHDFNTEFSDPTPGPDALTKRARKLLADGQMIVLLPDEAPVGLALLRFKPSIWNDKLEAYLEELYVEPPRRGEGIGRALMEGAMETAREEGSAYMGLCTGETDAGARSLYESCGFTNREHGPDGPMMLFYERDL